MRRECNPAAEVRVGEQEVSIRRSSSSEAQVAKILGREDDGRRLYLDRLIHAPWEARLGTWRCEGAVSTILTLEE